MLVATMRRFVMAVALLVVVGVASVAWLMTREPSGAEAARIAAVLQDTAPLNEPASYAHCASCHLHDGSGRPDGSMPSLNGQRRAVLEHKLYRLRTGIARLPVMDPFARTLAPSEIVQIATYLSQLPMAAAAPSALAAEEQVRGASLYAQHCSSCHGVNGEGNDGLFAARLCGQHGGYLERRLAEVAARTRGDADAIMRDAIDSIPGDDLRAIVRWLAAGNGCTSP